MIDSSFRDCIIRKNNIIITIILNILNPKAFIFVSQQGISILIANLFPLYKKTFASYFPISTFIIFFFILSLVLPRQC